MQEPSVTFAVVPRATAVARGATSAHAIRRDADRRRRPWRRTPRAGRSRGGGGARVRRPAPLCGGAAARARRGPRGRRGGARRRLPRTTAVSREVGTALVMYDGL